MSPGERPRDTTKGINTRQPATRFGFFKAFNNQRRMQDKVVPNTRPASFRDFRLPRRMAELRAKYFGEQPAQGRLSGWTLAGVFALWIVTPLAALWSSHLCDKHGADSLLTAIMSVQKVTPFYWGQNRFGNLLPFLTAWIHGIRLNFEVQVYLRALGAASTPLFVFSFIGLRRHLVFTYAIALALMFLPFRDAANFSIWADAQPYGQSILLLLAAFLLHVRATGSHRWQAVAQRTGILFFTCLALFVNSGLILLALPLLVGDAVLFPARRNWFFVFALLAGYFLANFLGTFYGQEYYTAFSYTHFVFKASNLASAFQSVASAFSSPGRDSVICFTFIAGGLLMTQLSTLRGRVAGAALLNPFVARCLLVLAAAAAYMLVIANLWWISFNSFQFRYFLPAVVFVISVSSAALTQGLDAAALPWQTPVAKNPRPRTPAFAAASIAIILVAAAVIQKIAPFECARSFVESSRRNDVLAVAALARKHHASFISGTDYYIVWPAVFEAIAAEQANGNAAPGIYGLIERGEAMRAKITRLLLSSSRAIVLNVTTEDNDPSPARTAALNENAATTYALNYDAVNWPPYESLLAGGRLGPGTTYGVFSFDRAPANRGQSPFLSAALLRMLEVSEDAARRDKSGIAVAANHRMQRAWKGPFVNLPPGAYHLEFHIEMPQQQTTGPLFALAVTDGRNSYEYAARKFSASDLQSKETGTWASLDFDVPAERTTREMEFPLVTFGMAPFSVTDVRLSRR